MEDGAVQSISQMVKNDLPAAGVSRRRMAFGPFSTVQSVASPVQPSTSTASAELDQNAALSLGKTTRKWGMWNNLESNAFYDGIKQYGKDFDQVAKIMAKKKMTKDKDQIRNYYYNSLKLLRSTAPLDDDIFADFPRDARELFVVINAFEWKKRTEDMKLDPVKLRQLLVEGSTSIRLKKKKQNLVIRTPFCPSLQRFFPSRKTKEPLPSYVTIWLAPKMEEDRTYVESCGQNPLLKIRVSVADQIARIFSLLKSKWISRLAKQDIFQHEELSTASENFCITLFPDKNTRVESVYLKYVKDANTSLFSLNRLKKERNWPHLENDDQDKRKNVAALCPFAKLDGATNEDVAAEIQDVSFTETNAFGLNAIKLRAGLNEHVVGKSSVTELFYLCGMESDIHLQYSVNLGKWSGVEPWNIFVSLINRNYGENLCKALSEPNDLENSQRITVTVEGTRKRRASASVQPEVIEQLASTLEKRPCEPGPSSSASNEVVNNDHVVESENNAFILQLESMQHLKRKGRLLVHRSAPTKAAAASKLSPQPFQIGSFVTSIKPAFTAVPGPDCYFLSAQDMAEARGTNNGQFIDFSSIACSRSQSQTPFENPGYQPCTVEATGNAHVVTKVLTPVRSQNPHELANDVSFLHSGGASTAQRVAPENFSTTAGPEATQKTLIQLSSMEFCNSVPNLDLTPTKNTSNLPEDVRHSFEMMMQQNSVDYCRNFEQLITSIETPKKFS